MTDKNPRNKLNENIGKVDTDKFKFSDICTIIFILLGCKLVTK